MILEVGLQTTANSFYKIN